MSVVALDAESEGVPRDAMAQFFSKQIASASADKSARISTLAIVWQAAHAGPVRQATFTANGAQVLSGSDDKTVKIWNAADGKEAKSIAAHDAPVIGVGISADGARIVSAGADKAVKVSTVANFKAGMPDVPTSAIVLPAPVESVERTARRSGRGSSQRRGVGVSASSARRRSARQIRPTCPRP